MRFNIHTERQGRLPALTFGSGNSWSYGTIRPVVVGGQPSTTLFENPKFPGVLLKKVSSLGEILASCNGIMYAGGPYGSETYLLVGSVFQRALDHYFPDYSPTDGNPYVRFAYSMGAGDINSFADATYDADLQVQIPRVASSDPFLVSAGGVAKDQSSLSFTNVYGVIALADAGFGTDTCLLPFYDLGNAYWLSNRLTLGTIAQVLRDNKTLFAGHGDGQQYVDMAVADYIRAGAHRDVSLGCHVATVYGRPGMNAPHTLRFGIPRVHPLCSYVSYPTLDFPFVFPLCGVTRVSTDDKMIDSVARGHRLVEAIATGDGTHFGATPFPGGTWPAVVVEAIARLKEVPEKFLSPGASDQMPVYAPVGGALTSLGSTSAFVAPVSWLVDVLKGPLGSPGYVEFLEATRDILADAESYAKAA